MSSTTESIPHEAPVYLRVRAIEPNPDPTHAWTAELLLEIEFVDPPRTRVIGLAQHWYLPYHEALQEAVRSQQVYWVDAVDGDDFEMPSVPPSDDEIAVVHRLLNAIQNRQIVSPAPAADASSS